MRISDWSSDVCSSDLPAGRDQPQLGPDQPQRKRHRRACEQQINSPAGGIDHRERSSLSRSDGEVAARSTDGGVRALPSRPPPHLLRKRSPPPLPPPRADRTKIPPPPGLPPVRADPPRPAPHPGPPTRRRPHA